MPRPALKVVVVDDRPAMGLAAFLEKIPGVCVCAQAGTPARALEAVESAKADAVVLDISLPRLGGIALARAIRKLHPEVRVVAVSTESDQALWEEALAAGAHAFVLREDAADCLGSALEAKRRYLDPRLRPPAQQKRPRFIPKTASWGTSGVLLSSR